MKILGYDYLIDQSKTNSTLGVMGRMNARALTIQIAGDIAPEQKASTLLHEVIEAASYHLDLGLEERQVMGLEVCLYQVLKDAGIDLAPLLEEKR